jgi:hypothetical protein
MFTNQMQKTIKILKSIKPSVTIVFIVSVGYALLYQLWFLRIPEIFPYANDFGIITFNLVLALAASSLFYFIVIHVDEYYNKQKAFRIVKRKVTRLINIENAVTKAVADKSNEELSKDNYSKDSFDKLFKAITSKDVAPKLFFVEKEEINWLEYLFYFVNDTQLIIKEIYQFMPYLDLDLLLILDDLESCKYFEFFTIFQKATYTYPNLSIIANYYFTYTSLISRLEEYFLKVNRYYSI